MKKKSPVDGKGPKKKGANKTALFRHAKKDGSKEATGKTKLEQESPKNIKSEYQPTKRESKVPSGGFISSPTKPARTGITRITIENFKGIGDKVDIPIRPITLFFGANSAGKSTVLQALLYLRELLEEEIPMLIA